MLDQVTIQLARFTVTAPISGTVVTRTPDPGQLVDPTTALFTLADLSTLIVEADVDESYAVEIREGQTAQLQLVGQRQVLAGALVFVSPRVDPATGGLAIRIGFDAPVKAPLGLTVTANILVGEQQAITVPRTALTGEAVFRMMDGRAVLTPETVIDWLAAGLIVTQGLTPSDLVIIGSTGVADGQAVTASAALEGP